MEINEKKSGYVIANLNVGVGNIPALFIVSSDSINDWYFGSMREAFIFDTEDEAKRFIDTYDLDIRDIQIMQIEYEFNGKVF